ncbi:MAG TPA: HupE/UreJ family protein [Leptolyngbyaceae cyanobacterium]
MSKFSLSIVPFQSKRPIAKRKRGFNPIAITGLGAGALLSMTTPVMAHHAFGNRTPANFFEGFLSGLAHPLIGLDHFAFIVAVGLLAVGLPRAALIPAGFILTALAGTGLHLLNLDLPGAEIAIATSVIALGIMLISQKRQNVKLIAALAAFAGLFHGYAYGEAIVGARMTPLFAYLLGFSIIQYLIALLALFIGIFVTKKFAHQPISPLRLAGLVISAIGISFLTASLIG